MGIREKYGKVAVVMGGFCSEREVSLISGMEVLNSLLSSGVDAHKFDPSEEPLNNLLLKKFDRAFILLHGRDGEDGTVQGALECMKLPYTGSGVLASSLAMDKYRTKLIWQSCNIPMAKSVYLSKNNFDFATFNLELPFPVVVKPVCNGSTLGLSKVFKLEDLPEAITHAFNHDSHILIEQMIIGGEYTITLDDNNTYPIIKIEAPSGEYDYKNKYFTDYVRYLCPYDLGELGKKVATFARCGYNAVGARGVVRLDFMLDEQKNVYFLEINTIPGMTPHSLVPMAFKAVNVTFDQLCLYVLDQAKLDN